MAATRRNLAWSAAALVCLLTAAGLSHVSWRSISQPGKAEVRVAPSGATWVAAEPEPAATDDLLRAGNVSGGAVTYLKFQVSGPAPGATLQLTSAEELLPELVELVAVPDASWNPETLTWQTAPVLGRVVQSVRPTLDDRVVSFELGDALSGPGVYAYAVTVPPDRGAASFVGLDGGTDQPVLLLPAPPASPTTSPVPSSSPEAYPVASQSAAPSPSPSPTLPVVPGCELGERLVPTCGVLWGVAPASHTDLPRAEALAGFEADTGRRQDIFHTYHRGTQLFPTPEEVQIASDGRILFLNWKPHRWSWAQVAEGAADSYLDRLAAHINQTYQDPFFLTVHHEPENDVRQRAGSGMQATDYAAMFRHVVQRLRAQGVDNAVTVVAYMAYEPWNSRPWFPDLYPGDEVVDWVGWDVYAYSDPGYGHGDFAEMINRRSSRYPDWPGFYNWATEQFPDKPFMLAEWGVWHSGRNPGHMAEFYQSVSRQTPLFPRVKALVYFDTPADQRDMDSRPTATGPGLDAYRRLGAKPYFQVQLDRTPPEASCH